MTADATRTPADVFEAIPFYASDRSGWNTCTTILTVNGR